MINYILKRILLGILSLFLLVVIVFFLLGAVKASPIDQSHYKDKATYDAVIASFGLDKPIIVRFGMYIKGLFHGTLGNVYDPNTVGASSISKLFFSPLKYTILVTSIAFIIGSILGIILGFYAGYKAGKASDVAINFAVIFFVAIPTFVLAAFLIALAPKIGLPSSFQDWNVYGWGNSLLSMFLPILVLVVTSLSTITYYIRNEIKAILVSDYILNARAKGLSEWEIFKKYVWRNALIPLVTIIIPSFVLLLAGSLVVEQFFGIPGTSQVIVNAVKSGETDVVMFNVMFFGFLAISSRILVDVLYVFIDPRIKYSSATETKNLGIISAIKRLRMKSKVNYE